MEASHRSAAVTEEDRHAVTLAGSGGLSGVQVHARVRVPKASGTWNVALIVDCQTASLCLVP